MLRALYASRLGETGKCLHCGSFLFPPVDTCLFLLCPLSQPPLDEEPGLSSRADVASIPSPATMKRLAAQDLSLIHI
eukprot:8149707-Alexandrium_andersonii.AAC.1